MCNAYHELVRLLVAKSRGQKPFIFPRANQQRTTSRCAHIHSDSEWLACPCWATSDSSSHEVTRGRSKMVGAVTTCKRSSAFWRELMEKRRPNTRANHLSFPFLSSPLVNARVLCWLPSSLFVLLLCYAVSHCAAVTKQQHQQQRVSIQPQLQTIQASTFER